MRSRAFCSLAWAAAALLGCLQGHAAEQVTLKNGFDMICDHRAAIGGTTRLYITTGSSSFVDVPTEQIASIDPAPDRAPRPAPDPASAMPIQVAPAVLPVPENLTKGELHELLSTAGKERNLDVDLLDCVVHAESDGRVHAVSRTGAKGLMQLMPGTASELGVMDSFRPDQNVQGGTTYLNELLIRYHDNLALALAAYNAGPAAVDRYHGVPPFRETRAYVARIIHAFNQRKLGEAAQMRPTERAVNTLKPGAERSQQP